MRGIRFLAFFFLPLLAHADTAAEIWTAKCASCHGEDGQGKTKQGEKAKVHDMTAPEYKKKFSDAEMKKTIQEGKAGTKMKAFKDKLTPAEIDSLVARVRGFAK